MGDRDGIVDRGFDRVAAVLAHHSERLDGRRAVRRFVVAAVAMPLVALVLVVVADLVPDRWVMDRLFDATVDGTLDEESYDRGYAGGLVDGFSECKRLTVGLGDPPGRNALESAVLSPTLGGCDVAVPKIEGWAAGDGLQRSYDYARYWNGSAVLFRPMTALVGVTAMRVLAGVAVAAATVCFWSVARRRTGALVASAVVLTMTLTVDVIDLSGALLHALAWSVALGSAALIMLLPRDATNRVIAWWMFVAGGVFLFLADMTNPELAWALAVAAVAFSVRPGRPPAESAGRVAVAAAAWIVGYAWLWSTKWLVYGLVGGFDRAWSDVTDQIDSRLGGSVGATAPTALDALDRVVSAWWDAPLTPVVTGVLVVVGAAIVVRRSSPQVRFVDRLILAVPALIPIVWYAALRTHTYLHYWFVYRSFAVSVAIVAGAGLIGRSAPRSRS